MTTFAEAPSAEAPSAVRTETRDEGGGAVPTDARTAAAGAAADLVEQAGACGLDVVAVACWPAGETDDEPPALPAFIVSAFSPMIAEVATRCLTAARTGRGGSDPNSAGPNSADRGGSDRNSAGTAGAKKDGAESATAVVVMSPLGDITSAEYVAQAVADGTRIGPLMFFQAVPNAVAGLIAARWGLTGPMVSLGAADGGLGVAAALIEDGDATGALILLAESAPDRAVALLVTARAAGSSTESYAETARDDELGRHEGEC